MCKKNKIKRIIYKYVNSRKNENFQSNITKHSFYNLYIEYIYPHQNFKSGYFLRNNHSFDCDYLYDKKTDINRKEIFNKAFFIQK